MGNFARISADTVVELVTTNRDLSTMFHPALDWREVDADIALGWCLTESGFEAPAPPGVMERIQPTLAQLEAELNTLSARFAALQVG